MVTVIHDALSQVSVCAEGLPLGLGSWTVGRFEVPPTITVSEHGLGLAQKDPCGQEERPLKCPAQAMSAVYPRLDNEDYGHQQITRRHCQ